MRNYSNGPHKQMQAATDSVVGQHLKTLGGKPVTSREMAALSGLTMGTATYSLRRLVRDGLAMSSMRRDVAPGRGHDVVPVYVSACCMGQYLGGYPEWLAAVRPPAQFVRRVIVGRAGTLNQQDDDDDDEFDDHGE